MFSENQNLLEKKSQQLGSSDFITQFNWVYSHLNHLKRFSTKEKFNAFCKFITTRNCFKPNSDYQQILKQQISSGSFNYPPSTLDIHLLIDFLTQPNSFSENLITFLNQNIALTQHDHHYPKISTHQKHSCSTKKNNNLTTPKFNQFKPQLASDAYNNLSSEEKHIYDKMQLQSHPIFKWEAIQTGLTYYNNGTVKDNSRAALDLFLKKKNIELNKVIINSLPLIHYVISIFDNESLTVLIEHKVCLNLKSNTNQSPIEFILNLKPENSKLNKLKNCLKALITHDDTFNSNDDLKRACAIWATTHGFIDLLELLIQKKTNLNVIDNNGNSLLCLAVNFNHNDLLNRLIKTGIDINNANDFGETPTFIASWNGNYLGLSYLLDTGSNLNKSDKTGQTPIHISLFNNNKSVLLLLLEYGADIKQMDKYGNLALNNSSRSSECALLVSKISSADLILPNLLTQQNTPKHINLDEFKSLMKKRHCALIAHQILANNTLTDIQKQFLKTLSKQDKQFIIKIAQNHLNLSIPSLTIAELQYQISL